MKENMDNHDIAMLVQQVMKGDEKAFELLYQQTNRQIYYTCRSFLENEQDIYDTMQDTYLQAFTHIGQLREQERFVAWLNQIAVNKCKNLLGKKKLVSIDDVEEDVLPEENDAFVPEAYVNDQAKRKIIVQIMQTKLSKLQYQTVMFYYFDGMTIAEIAQCMDCPEGTVSYRLSVARGKIKQGILEYEEKSGDKLYSVSGLTMLTAVFMLESREVSLPDILTTVFNNAKQSQKEQPEQKKRSQKGAEGKRFLSTAAGKAVICGAAGIIVAGGIVTAVLLKHKADNKGNDYATEYTESEEYAYDNTEHEDYGSESASPSTEESEKKEGLEELSFYYYDENCDGSNNPVFDKKIIDAYSLVGGDTMVLTEGGDVYVTKQQGYNRYTLDLLKADSGLVDLDRVIGEYSDYIESFVADSEQNYIYVIKMPQGDLRQCEDGVPFDFAGHFRDDMNVVGMHDVIGFVNAVDSDGNYYSASFLYDDDGTKWNIPDGAGIIDNEKLWIDAQGNSNNEMADGVIVAAECGAWSLTTDGGLYFHDPGYSNMEDTLYEDTADKKFTGLYGIYESNWYMWDALGLTEDGKLIHLGVDRTTEAVYDMPEGEVLSINASAHRIIVHTTTGYYVLKIDTDTEFTPCDVLNDMADDIMHVHGEQIVTKGGRVYRFTED